MVEGFTPVGSLAALAGSGICLAFLEFLTARDGGLREGCTNNTFIKKSNEPHKTHQLTGNWQRFRWYQDKLQGTRWTS